MNLFLIINPTPLVTSHIVNRVTFLSLENMEESQNMEFLKVNDESISLDRALAYLKSSGGYHRTMTDILRQYTLEKELQHRNDIEFSSLQVDQALMDFRVENDLRDSQSFQGWMQANGVNYEQFRQNIEFGFKIQQLRQEVTEPKLLDYFNDRKPFLDRVILSRLILEDKELAEQLTQKISADPSNFESLVQTHSITDDRVANGIMGAIPKAQMPEILRTAVDSANPGDIVGPMEIEGRYCLFRVEKFVPATLDDLNLKQELMNQIFEQWIHSKIQAMDIRLDIN
jgi:parvulin-like peptidyl-prolyl isomerase